ncbi:hypothetical protein [Streptomyces sp. NBC_01601]|uniref:hypothetical protein n=1 Tax=Streptomyces sp. NBC_01601 TaxID=2975892 RepID=UPI002E2A8782|nr:hypothetical protein [Streptomyces sp. NBC_01601]
MCRSVAMGGRRCAASHPAVRAAKRATARLAQSMAAVDAGHPAQGPYSSAQVWAARAKVAAEAGDDDKAALYAGNAKTCAAATRDMLADRGSKPRYPPTADPRAAYAMGPRPAKNQPSDTWSAPEPPEYPEHVRAASAFAQASGAGGRATFLPRGDGGQTVAWSGEDFSGAATVYPGEGEEPPYARVVFTRLDRDRYQALADSPWPYRVERGQVVYDRVPTDHAEQIITAARTGQAAKPWERHGLGGREERVRLDEERAAALEPESQRWAGHLTDDQRHWVSAYTGVGHKAINAHLYNGEDLSRPAGRMSVPMHEVTRHLDAAIDAAGVADTPHHGFRGYTPPLEVRQQNRVAAWVKENFVVGGRYRSEGYMSVSHCPRVAAGFADRTWLDDNGRSGVADHGVVFETLSRRGAAVASASAQGNAERERVHKRQSDWVVVGVQEDVEVEGKPCVVVQLVDARDLPRH